MTCRSHLTSVLIYRLKTCARTDSLSRVQLRKPLLPKAVCELASAYFRRNGSSLAVELWFTV